MMIAQLEATAGRINRFDGHGFASKSNASGSHYALSATKPPPRAVPIAKAKYFRASHAAIGKFHGRE